MTLRATFAAVGVELRMDVAADRGRPAAHRDVLVSLLGSRGVQSVTLYRLSRYLHVAGHNVAARLVARINQLVFHVDISPDATIGPGLVLRHAHGVVIGATTIIGRDSVIFHGATVGRRDMRRGTPTWEQLPTIGDRVTLGANAAVLGPISIGDDVVVGAGAVVMHDVPARASVRAPEPTVVVDRVEAPPAIS